MLSRLVERMHGALQVIMPRRLVESINGALQVIILCQLLKRRVCMVYEGDNAYR